MQEIVLKLVELDFKDKLESVFGQFSKEVEMEIQKGNIRSVSPLNIVFSIMSLNINFFILKPIILEALGMDEDHFNQLAIKRKEENVMTILNSLRPL